MPRLVPPEAGTDAPARAASLDVFFSPEAVAVFGSANPPGSAGRALLANLTCDPLGAPVFVIDSEVPRVGGVKTYRSLRDVPGPVDLAVVATPAAQVPDVLGECVESGVPGTIILPASVRECGPAGGELGSQIREVLRGSGMRVLGPNSLGVVCPRTGMNASFAPAMPRPGSIGFLSRGGELLTALLAEGQPDSLGCSRFVSVGDHLDVGWGEWIEYLGEDVQTECIAIHLDSVAAPPSLLEACRKVAPHKPVLVLKGPSDRDECFDEALRRSGALRVYSVDDLLWAARLLTTHPRPRGRRLAVLGNAGGLAVLAADALASGGELAPLAPETVAALGTVLPAGCARDNPIDVGEDAGPDRTAEAAALAAQDPNTDGLLLVLARRPTLDPAELAERVAPLAGQCGKPVLASWVGGADGPAGGALLERAGVPTFPTPHDAVRVFASLCQQGETVRRLFQLAAPAGPHPGVVPYAGGVIESARRADRTLLTGREYQQLLASYSLPVLETRPAASKREAAAVAEALGYPVVLAPLPEDEAPAEESDVRLTARDPEGLARAYRTLEVLAREQGCAFRGVQVQPLVRRAGYQLRLSSTAGPKFGPALQLGPGGPWAPASSGRVLALPPLDLATARQMVEQTGLLSFLRSAHDRGEVDLLALEEFLVRFSRLVTEQPIREAVVDPLLLTPGRVLAVGGRVTLYRASRPVERPASPVRPRARAGAWGEAAAAAKLPV
jgi:acetyltransferase